MAKRAGRNVLRAAREALALSQADIAAKLGITPAAVGHYEKGIAKPPMERARQLARILKIDVADIAVSSRAQRGSRKAAREAGERQVSAREMELLTVLRNLPLAKRRLVLDMVLGYAARVSAD